MNKSQYLYNKDVSCTGTSSDSVISSTYFQLLERCDTILRSLIITIKMNWTQFGTLWNPCVVWSHRDMHCPNLTHRRRLQRKLQIKGIIERRTPKLINFVTTMLWSILSKALLKLTNSRLVWCLIMLCFYILVAWMSFNLFLNKVKPKIPNEKYYGYY